jgi:coenzyme F420 hydrogenase subunit beta
VSPSTGQGTRRFEDIDPRTCTHCGACVSICPVGVITTSGHEVQLQDGCLECGLCYRFCPGRELDFAALSKTYLGAFPDDPLLGHFRRLSVAQATSQEVRERGTSGGVVTALLLHLLETNQMQGALGVTMDGDRPWACHAALLTSTEEVKKAAQSKYSLVSLAALLGSARRQPGSLAVVGLPCHVHGLRRLQRLGSYRAKFPLSIGLFCGFNLLPAATDHLIAKTGFTKEQVVELQYRGGPWPGGLLVRSRNGEQRFIPKSSHSYVNLSHVPRRCLVCPDLTNELADLSVGDTWLEEYAGGWSTVICRSPQGERLLAEAADAGVLRVQDISRREFLRSHGHLLAYKKEGYFVRQRWLRVPLSYVVLRPRISRRRWMGQSLLLAMILALSNRPARWMLQRLPLSWLGWLSRRGRTAATSGESWPAW